ncbi:DUF6049 family protein [Agromyces sp. NPDC049794]|uniref:DUF6049 family protein n=1 Tax=unclassified Agromyces TaxID=2639701 RepID=UPI0033CFF73F
MVAEVRPARRRAGSPALRTSRRGRAIVAGFASVALAGILATPIAATAGVDSAGLQAMLGLGAAGGAGAADADGAAAPARSGQLQSAAEEDGGLSLRVTPTISTSLSLAGPVTISVEIENATGESLPPSNLRLVRADDVIDEEGELSDWLAIGGGEGEGLGEAGATVAESEARGVAAGGTALVSLTIPPEQLAELARSPVIGLGAELVVGDTVMATGTDAYPNADVPASGSVAVALVAPLTLPVADGTTGIIPAAQLENWTGPTGVLTRQLDALTGRRVAIGLDPRILASIRVLGTSAPASATTWLQRLAMLPNEIFPLAYADADVALQSQIGLPALLAPTSFADVMDPANFTAPAGGGGDGTGDTEGETEGGSGDVEPTDAPTEPETADAVPTTDELLDWPYTRSDLAWPADDTVAPGDLAYLDASGLTTAVLAPTNVEPVEGPSSAAALIDGSTALVADAGLTEPLRAAADAQTEAEWRAATGRLLAELALDAGVARTTMLATFDRGAPTLADRVSGVIDEIEASRWATLAGLSEAIGAPPEPRTLVDEAEADDRRSTATRMMALETDVAAFASVLVEPELLTAPTRRDLLSILDVAWLDEGDGWNAAAGEWIGQQRDTLGSVSVVPSSPINVVSTETGVPTTIDNSLPYPVTVLVEVEPSNGRLIVEDRVEVTVGPESRSTVRVPVAAGVGNGDVSLVVSLTSPTGVTIGTPVTIPANVQADWEGLGAAILAAILVLVFSIGIWRNIRRRRRARAESAADVAADGVGADASRSPGDALDDAPKGATHAEARHEPDTDTDTDTDIERPARG